MGLRQWWRKQFHAELLSRRTELDTEAKKANDLERRMMEIQAKAFAAERDRRNPYDW